MTVITHAISEKKEQKTPLTDAVDGIPAQGRTPRDPESQSAILVQVQRNRLRQVQSLTTTCVFLCALGLFCAGLFASFYVYQQYNQYRMRHFKGWCSIPYVEDKADSDMEQIESLMDRMQALSDPLSMDDSEPRISLLDDEKNKGRRPFRFFEEEFDLDLENEAYEKIEVPEFSHGRKGRFIHDFSFNKTAIVDIEGGRCFILDLNRSRVLPPKSLFDMITKLSSTYYDVDTEMVRETYRVKTPAVDLKEDEVGMVIQRECEPYNSYLLERMTNPIVKRSAFGEEEKTFTELAGPKVSQFHIVNLDSVPGRK